MNRVRSKNQGKRLMLWMSSTLLVLLFSMIPVRLAIAYVQSPQPQAILTLGGDFQRELFTVEFSKNYPELDIWVSSGSPPEVALDIFQSAGVPEERLHLDYRAADTVTNFTSLVKEFKSRQIQHIYLITSDFHLPRSTAIATLILGSHGIAFTPISVPSNYPPESRLRILRDIGRCLLWILTGHTGASLNSYVQSFQFNKTN